MFRLMDVNDQDNLAYGLCAVQRKRGILAHTRGNWFDNPPLNGGQNP